MKKLPSKMSDEELKRAGQMINAAQETYPDNTAQYAAFVTGAMWADINPASDNEWHNVSDGVDPTKEREDTSNTILYIDGYRNLYVTTIATIEDVYKTFGNFVWHNDVRYWSYARAFVPDAIYDELFREAMNANRDEE